MTNQLDTLPDEVYQMIFYQVKRVSIQQAAAIGAPRNRFTYIPNRRTIDSVIYHWLRDKPEKASSMWTDGDVIYFYQMAIGFTDQVGKKVLRNHTARGIGFVSQTTSQHVVRVYHYADETVDA